MDKLEINYGVDILLVLIAVLGFLTFIAAGFFGIENGTIFYYKTSIGQCWSDQESCDTYPIIAKYVFLPFALFGEQNFYLITKILVFLIPSMIFYFAYKEQAIALLYLISPISLMLAFGGYLSQFLAFILFMLVMKYHKELFLVTVPLAIGVQRYALALITMFAITLGLHQHLGRFDSHMKFLIIAAMATAMVSLFASGILPIYSIFQTSWASIVLYTLPLTAFFLNTKGSAQNTLMVLLCLAAVSSVILLYQVHRPTVLHLFTDFNFSRFWETYDFVLLVCLCKR